LLISQPNDNSRKLIPRTMHSPDPKNFLKHLTSNITQTNKNNQHYRKAFQWILKIKWHPSSTNINPLLFICPTKTILQFIKHWIRPAFIRCALKKVTLNPPINIFKRNDKITWTKLIINQTRNYWRYLKIYSSCYPISKNRQKMDKITH
jgi:hypothetical protein